MADNTTLNTGTGGDVIATDDIGGVKFQRVKLVQGADGVNGGDVSATNPLPIEVTDGTNFTTVLTDGGTGYGLGTSLMSTNFVASTGNSTTAQLAASATFTGTIESVFNQQSISLLLTSDQNGTLTIKQYIDSGGTRLISSWAISITAGTPFSRAFTANGNYFNLTFQNTGGSTTTTLRIDTAYGTLTPSTNLGNVPNSLNEVNGTAISLGQVTMAASLPVAIASNQTSIPVTDNSGSLTVDAPVATPVFVRLSDGAAAISALPITDNAGSLTVDAPVGTPVFVRLSDGTSALNTGAGTATGALRVELPTNGTGVVGLNAGTNRIGSVRPVDSADADLTAAKGTQTSRAIGTQDLKDAGRTSIMLTATVASTATTETLITLTRSVGLAATTTGSSLSITSGKKFRIQSIAASVRNSTGTTAGVGTIKLRGAVAGSTTASSPLQMTLSVAIPASAASTLFPNMAIPDGFEIDSNSGTNTYGVTITHPQWVTGSVVATFDITIIGYEY